MECHKLFNDFYMCEMIYDATLQVKGHVFPLSSNENRVGTLKDNVM